MRPAIVKTVFLKELREMLRDRRSLAIMFGIPLLVYPLLTIGLSTLTSSRQQELRATTYKIAVVNAEDAPALVERITAGPAPDADDQDEPGDQDDGTGAPATEPAATQPQTDHFEIVATDDPLAALRAEELAAVVEVPPEAQDRALAAEDVEIVVHVDESRSQTPFVRRRISQAIDDYERWVIEARLAQRGVTPEVLRGIETRIEDVATAEARLGLRLAQLLPLLLLVTGMLGSLFPALNATTSERELGTLETLLVSPASRLELLTAKGAIVLLSGLLTAGLNMFSMSLVLWRVFSAMEQADVGDLQIGLWPLLLSYLAAVPALIFFTTIVLIIGLMARNFREANAFATPVMLLPLASAALTIMDPPTTPGLLITPVANTTIIIRDVLTGRGTWEAFALAFASSCVYAGLMLSVAGRLFSNEQLVNPAWEPISLRGLRFGKKGQGKLRPRRVPAVDEAVALFAVVLLLLFYVSPSMEPYGLVPVLLVNMVLLLGVPTLLFALGGRWAWRPTFALRWPGVTELLAAALVGLGVVPFVMLLHGLQVQVWPPSPELQEANARLFRPWLESAPVFTALLVGVLAGFFEELLFRGAIQSALIKRLPPWIAIFAGALLFAVAHLDPHGVPIRWLLGVILGWVVWRGGSIVPAMLLHAVYNAAQLGISAWSLRREGADALNTAPPTVSELFTRQSLTEMAIGAGLLIAGLILFRLAWRHEDARGGDAGVNVHEAGAAAPSNANASS